MTALISLISVLAGTAFAYASDRVPERQVVLEYASGIMLIGGLSVLGGALRFFC